MLLTEDFKYGLMLAKVSTHVRIAVKCDPSNWQSIAVKWKIWNLLLFDCSDMGKHGVAAREKLING